MSGPGHGSGERIGSKMQGCFHGHLIVFVELEFYQFNAPGFAGTVDRRIRQNDGFSTGGERVAKFPFIKYYIDYQHVD